MKVLIADLFSEDGIKELQAQGMEVVYNHSLNGESLTKAMAEVQPHVLVVRSTKVQKGDIDADPKLQMVLRAGAGYDTIDFNYCSKKGIYVTNCPGKNATAVAELAMALILSIDRRMGEGIQLLKEGKWNKGMFANCVGLKGRTLGLIGFGNIAQLVCSRAKAFEMNVLVHTRTKQESLAKQMGFQYAENLEDLLKRSDIVSLHTPGTPETKGMVNKDFLKHMKNESVLINTARGAVVNDADLLAHLEESKGFWYGTDVFNGEPAAKETPFDNAIAKHPRTYATHHIGASTKQAEGAIGDEAVRIIKKFANSGDVDDENCVNKEKKIQEDMKKIAIRHYDRVGILQHCFSVLAKYAINCQELENIVFKEREACVCNLWLQGDLSQLDKMVQEMKENQNIIEITY